MRALNLTTPQDVLALLVRRKWWIICTFILAFCASATAVFMLPKVYRSETLVFVKTRGVPTDVVRDVLGGTEVEQRLAVIKEVIFSKTSLKKILEEFKDELKFKPGDDEEARILAFDESIETTFQSIRGGGTFFRVAYESDNPELAQRVVNRLSTLFIEFDNRNRENRASETSEFLQTELGKVAEELAAAESSVRSMKEQNRFQLPEQLDGNLRNLNLLEGQLKTNKEALERYLPLRQSLEERLAATPEKLVTTLRTADPVAQISPEMQEYRVVAERYRILKDRYTDKHPDVLTLKTQLDRLEASIPPVELAKEEAAATVREAQNPAYDNLNKQLQEVKTEIAIREREAQSIQTEITRITARIQATPRIEEAIQAATRLTGDLNKRYNDLGAKVTAAQLSESLGRAERESEYSIIDKANLPIEPSRPNRRLLLLLCFAGCLGFGAVVGAGIDFLDQKIWTQGELEKLVGLSVLAEIPEITADMTALNEVKPEVLGPALGPARATAVLGDAAATAVLEANESTIYYDNPVVQQVRRIESENKTGVLTAAYGINVVRVYFKHGLISGVASSIPEHHLTGYIKDDKLVDAKVLRTLLKKASKTRTPVGAAAVEQDILTPGELIRLIRRQVVDTFRFMLTKGFTFKSFEPSARHFAYPLQSKLDSVLLEVMRGQATPFVMGMNERVILREGKSLPWQPMELSVLGEVRSPQSFDELAARTGLGGEELAKMLSVFRALGMIDILEIDQNVTTALFKSPTTWLEQVAPQVDVSWYNEKLVTLYNQHSFINEQFRSLKVRINRVNATRPVQVLSVCSPYPGDGKSVISANMALSLAKDPNRRTIIVDCDMRNPTLQSLLGIHAEPGLIQYLQDPRLQPYSCIRRFGNLFFMTSGGIAENSVELLSMDRMKQLLDFLRSAFDTIILDCPAMEPISDSQVLAAVSDSVVMVVRCGKTPYRSMERVFKTLDRSNVIGVVFNGVAPMMFHTSYERSYYQRGNKPGSRTRENKRAVRNYPNASVGNS